MDFCCDGPCVDGSGLARRILTLQHWSERGVKLGNPNLAAIRGSGGAAGKAEAERFAGNVLPIIKQVRKAGATTLQQIADALNDRGVATARGGSWYPSNVRNVLARG
jgi:hypothetical protein